MSFIRLNFRRLLEFDEENLKTSRLILKLMGIWSKEGSPIIMRVIGITAHLISLGVGVSSFLCSSDQDESRFGVSILMMAAGFCNVVKVLWYSYNSDKIGWLVKELDRITKENVKERSNKIELIKASIIPDRLTILLSIMILALLGLETLYSLFIASNKYRLMFNLYSFLDLTRYYYLAFCFQYFYSLWAGAGVLINFNLLLSFNMLIVANLSILENYLKSAPNNIKRSVDFHTDIIRFVRIMNEVLHPALICELATSSVLTCMCAYMCVKSITFEHKCAAYIMMCTESFIPWFICYCGSILEEKSKKLTDAVYSSRWVELKPKQRKEIIILMIATNRPLQIKISRTHIINFTYYTRFIQLTYSFLALLLSLKE